MIISPEKSFMFIHIPKAGGSSVREALSRYRNPLENTWIARFTRRIPILKNRYPFFNFYNSPHVSILRAKLILPESLYNKLYKFCSVRHPVSRHLSEYKHILRHHYSGPHSHYYQNVLKMGSFEDYIKWKVDLGPIPQLIQLVDESGTMQADDFARLETLNTDLKRIFHKIGINTEIKQKNYSPSDQNIQVSDKAIEIIYQEYRIDFDMFGYTENALKSVYKFRKGIIVSSVKEILRKIDGSFYNPWSLYKL